MQHAGMLATITPETSPLAARTRLQAFLHPVPAARQVKGHLAPGKAGLLVSQVQRLAVAHHCRGEGRREGRRGKGWKGGQVCAADLCTSSRDGGAGAAQAGGASGQLSRGAQQRAPAIQRPSGEAAARLQGTGKGPRAAVM